VFSYQVIHINWHMNEHTLSIFIMNYIERKDRLCICPSLRKDYVNLFMA